MAMIGTEPEKVAEYFNKLATNLYGTLTKKMQSSTLSSAYTIYNDKQMQTEQKEYKKLISQWEDKIETYEDRYRKQFAAMESALASLNAQQSQLGGLFAS
jgi:flagellar hook-associated protein 2